MDCSRTNAKLVTLIWTLLNQCHDRTEQLATLSRQLFHIFESGPRPPFTLFWLEKLSQSSGFGRFIRPRGDWSIYSCHPDGHVLLVTIGKNGRCRSQELDILDGQSCLFHDLPLSAGLKAFTMFEMPARVGDETFRTIRTLVFSQHAGHFQVRTRSMASFPFADQNVVISVASEHKDCNADTGSGHDDSCPEQILERNWLAACIEISFLRH